MARSTQRILIIAGGTGGHVMPALSVALLLKKQGWQLYWMGTQRGLEAQLIPGQGITIEYINVAGIRGKGRLTQLFAPFQILRATWQAFRIIRQIKPNVVLGMGGFVTGPGCLAAKLSRIPIVIHEQNAIAGLTNRYLARLARSVCSGFPDVFDPKYKPIVTGNPVRASITALASKVKSVQPRKSSLRLLIIGGSLGAKVLNERIPAALANLPEDVFINVWHQTGKHDAENVTKRYERLSISATVEPFIQNVASAYEWADLVICRAGASTIAELAACGMPSLLVPYPHAVDDHQYANGLYLAKVGGAEVWRESDFSAEKLTKWLTNLARDPDRLSTMGQAAHQLAISNATQALAEQCTLHAKSK